MEEINGKIVVKHIDAIVDTVYYATKIEPINAKAVLNSGNKNKFTYMGHKDGKEADKEKLREEIYSALRQNKSTLQIPFNVKSAQIKVEDMPLRTVKRGEFSTYYGNSSAERKYNIRLASSAINGFFLPSGEEFSFNETVGERSEKRGYKTAKIISDGKFADGVGGGVCQVSTTVYNCAILSGLTVTEWHRHSLAVSYVEKGFDAMVNAKVCDLKFRNDSGSDVYIECVADGERLTVRFYGIKNEYHYERVSVISSVISPEESEIIYTDELPEGEKKVLTYPTNGYTSKSYIKTYYNGELISEKQIRSDVYKSVRGVVAIGTFAE